MNKHRLPDRFRVPKAPDPPLISLVVAQARYELRSHELRLIEQWLEGKERRMPDGTVEYLVSDIEAAVQELNKF